MSYTARLLLGDFGSRRATIILTNPQGLNRSYKIPLRDWTAPDGEQYLLLAEFPEISDMEARYAVNMALLEFQEYQSQFESPGHAD